MAHTYLIGDEPTTESDQAAPRADDERTTAAMSVSRRMFDQAETDDTPAIERVYHAQEGVVTHNIEHAHGSAGAHPAFQIDANFAADIKRRNAAEQAARTQERKLAEQKAAQSRARRKKRIAQKLAETQSLDPKEIEAQLLAETRSKNDHQLYPDAKPIASEVEQAIWEKRKNKGAQIAGRARLFYVQNANLEMLLRIALILQIVCLAIFLLLSIISATVAKVTDWSIAYVLIALAVAATIALLYVAGESSDDRQIPSDLKNEYLLASLLPGLILRLIFITYIAKMLAIIPFISVLGAFVGAIIGGALHYSFINGYGIFTGTLTSFINTFIYTIYIVTPIVISTYSGQPITSYIFIVYIALFFVGDRIAGVLATGRW